MANDSSLPYAPELLRVDLSAGTIVREGVGPTVARRCLGGCALGAKYLYDEVPPEVGWSDPGNRLMLFTGPLTGAPIPGSGGVNVATKGALTNGAAQTQAQGVFGAYLRFAGLDGLIFQGAAERWSYLLVDESGNAELRDASHLVGKDTWETVDAIVGELGKRERDVSVLTIGPAGESLVRWAAILIDKGHVAAHNGVGAVMGSKKLKAVAIVRGRNRPSFADRARLSAVGKQIAAPVIARPGGIHTHGTLNGIHSNYATGNLPVRNYTTSRWAISDEDFAKFSGQYIHDSYQPRFAVKPCWGCSNHHCQMMTVSEGPYAGLVAEEPEYEQFSAFSANLGINDVTAAIKLSNVVDRLGLDANEAGWVLGCAMECFERGILTKSDADGLDLTWGNVEAALALVERIARRDGIGDVLAEGVRLAVRKIGRGAEEVGVYTQKGSTPRGHDHRARWTELFDTCVSDSGALDNTPGAAVDLTQFGLPSKLDPFDPDLIARAEGKMKGSLQFEDSLMTCRFNTRTDLTRLTEAVVAATGWDFTEAEAMAVGRRAVNTMRVYNLRCGLTGDLDRPSPRYGSTVPDGPAAGKSIGPHFEGMLQEYYGLMGWDERGRPKPETLRALGLEDLAADLPS